MRSSLALLPLLLAAGAAHAAPVSDEDQIRAALNTGCKSTIARDTDGMMAPFLKTTPDGLTMFDFGTPRTRNYAQLRQADADFAAAVVGAPECEYLEIHPVILSKDAAYSWAIMRAAGTLKDGSKLDFTIRSTDVWRKVAGRWQIVHEHNSFPVDMATGKPDFQSKP